MLHSSLSPVCFCVVSSCSVFESVSLITACSGAILGACQRGAAGEAAAVNTEPITWQRGLDVPCKWPRPGVPLVIFAKSPSSQSGQVKTLTCRACLLSTWLFFFLLFLPSLFSSQCLCLWPLVAHQAWMTRSSLQLSSQTAMIVLQGRQKIASAFWNGVL